ncbi:MAG: dinitrogenase iron-molybdenum cofactor biosynthesis protein [Planctomycetes bacterium]|jgi:predicted Fe-Mo cluster-binding NifX family protein|nr:dinitrogenase iron-molybdenum cofactor biosynthesis protein [Planctomycetota bacterium]
MRVAIPHWQGRVSPVLDTAGRCLLVDVVDGGEVGRQDIELSGQTPQLRGRCITGLGADVLICGAISRPLLSTLRSADVDVRPHVCGEIETILAALIDGRLEDDTFLMPGCCGRRRQGQGRRHRGGRCRESRD